MLRQLLLALCVVTTSATLLGTFCNNDLHFDNIPSNGHGAPAATYHARSICFTFKANDTFELQIVGVVQLSPSVYSTQAVCTGSYFFGAGNTIVIGYENYDPTICTQNSSLPGFCPWACAQFGGTYQAFFSQPLSEPRYFAVNPASVSPIYNWGLMEVTFPMECMNDTCGSATDIFPPAPIPQNSVRDPIKPCPSTTNAIACSSPIPLGKPRKPLPDGCIYIDDDYIDNVPYMDD